MIDIFQEIFDSLKRNKLRTFLTGFAVAWGIFMLIVLLGFGNGLVNAFMQHSEGIPTNVIELYGGFTSEPYEGLPVGRNIELYESDIDILKKNFANNFTTVEATLSTSATISSGDDYVSSSLEGVYPGYFEIQSMKMLKGRFINPVDLSEGRKVIVLHKNTAELLFKSPSRALGKFVKAGDVSYKVVGIYTDENTRSNPSAFIPFSTLRLIYNVGIAVNSIVIRTQGISSVAEGDAIDMKVREVLGKIHRFKFDDMRALWMNNYFKRSQEMGLASDVLNIALWVIGLFTLLSGVVGVSNIMLITVKERTREFGIRKALGARPFSILKLVITESIAITAFFGYIGMVLGIAATQYMDMVSGNKTTNVGFGDMTIFSNPTVGLAVAVEATITLIIAGTLAGFFPAWKAARVKPIEALRG